MKIAITGVGGGVGQSVIKSLASSDYELLGLDGELLGTGLYMTNNSYVIPYARDEQFIPRLLEICTQEKVKLLFPGLDAELLPLSRHTEDFKAIGTTLVVSRPEVVSIADNKQKTYDVLSSAGINVPFTCSTDDFNPEPENFPVIIKPREGGARSKNVFKVKTPKQYASVIQMLGEDTADYIVMDYIEGDEYTCGSISLDGKCHGIIVMRRQLRDGDTYKCFVENNDLIQEAVRKVVETVKPFGALNVQLRLKDQTPYIFELNARCSGTTAARTLSGFNEPKMIADYLLKGISPDFSIKEQSILRYWQELVVDNKEIAQISTARHLKK